MKRNAVWNALACAGAVIGAGFASGREVIVFFTRFGVHAYWLIAVAVAVMTALCLLCMQAAVREDGVGDWSALFGHQLIPEMISLLLMILTSGAMISAAGHMIALVWPIRQAYAFGALGTLLLAWLMGMRSMKPLSVFSALLTSALIIALMLGFSQPQQTVVPMNAGKVGLLKAFLDAVGYAAMNMTLAIGVVCKCAQKKGSWVTAGLFGWMMAVLLLLSSSLYRRHPELMNEAFPFVRLFAGYGRKGFLFSVVLLYLAILTTLISVIYSLRTAVEQRTTRWSMRILLVLAVPMAVSRLGFSEIVDRLYAPAGWACMFFLYLPLLRGEAARAGGN